MQRFEKFSGVYAAALTPLKENGAIQPDGVSIILEKLFSFGCHGALLSGTTGEGPSLGLESRLDLLRTAQEWRQVHPAFHLLVGTGMPSLEDTIRLTKAAFDLGIDGVVVLPPYYFRKFTDEGLFSWYSQVLQRCCAGWGGFLWLSYPWGHWYPAFARFIGTFKRRLPYPFCRDKGFFHFCPAGARFGRPDSEMIYWFLTAPIHSLPWLWKIRPPGVSPHWQTFEQSIWCGSGRRTPMAPKTWRRRRACKRCAVSPIVIHLRRRCSNVWSPMPIIFPAGRCSRRWSSFSAEKEQAVLADLDALPFDWRKYGSIFRIADRIFNLLMAENLQETRRTQFLLINLVLLVVLILC